MSPGIAPVIVVEQVVNVVDVHVDAVVVGVDVKTGKAENITHVFGGFVTMVVEFFL